MALIMLFSITASWQEKDITVNDAGNGKGRRAPAPASSIAASDTGLLGYLIFVAEDHGFPAARELAGA